MTSNQASESEASPRRRSYRRIVFGAMLIILGLVAMGPTILAKTALRDRLINAALQDESLTASTESASFGYLSPLSVTGFKLQAADGSLNVAMQSFESEKSWLQMLLADGDLGTFRFREPNLSVLTGIASKTEEAAPDQASAPVEAQKAKSTEGQASELTPEPAADADTGLDPTEGATTGAKPIASLPTLVAEVADASVLVRNVSREEPVIDLQGIDFKIRTETKDFGSFVHVEPTTILDEQPLTPELCSNGLQLVAPMLADAVVVQGRLSFRLDQCSIPVGDLDQQQRQERTDIGGAIRLSDVSVGLNNELTAKLVALLEPLGRTGNGVQLTVSRNSEVRFHVFNGRVHHEGLMFLLPIADSDFELTSRGSVGFDETLDLELTLGLPASLLGEGPLAKFLTSDPIVIQIGGNVDRPLVQLASNTDWNQRLTKLLGDLGQRNRQDPDGKVDQEAEAGDVRPAPEDAVLDVVGGLLQRDDREERAPLRNMLERRRDRRESAPQPRQRPGLLRRRPTPL